MPCLIEAFKEMRQRSLIAKRACYCPDCGRAKVEEAARKWQRKGKLAGGFVHFGEWGPTDSEDDVRMPLFFGTITDGRAVCGGSDCVAVGKIVAECLFDEGIAYVWDRTPESPIFVVADDMLSGLPAGSHDHEIPFDEPNIPESAFEELDGNPVRLLNLAAARRLGVDFPQRRDEPRRPRVGDRVTLGFLVWDAVPAHVRETCGDWVNNVQLEPMSVEVTQILRTSPECVYRGELLSVPLFFGPDVLRVGSPVTFTTDMIYPAQGAR